MYELAVGRGCVYVHMSPGVPDCVSMCTRVYLGRFTSHTIHLKTKPSPLSLSSPSQASAAHLHLPGAVVHQPEPGR